MEYLCFFYYKNPYKAAEKVFKKYLKHVLRACVCKRHASVCYFMGSLSVSTSYLYY